MPHDSPWIVAFRQVHRSAWLTACLLLGVMCCTLYPSDLDSYPAGGMSRPIPVGVTAVESTVRFVPTAAQIALPLLTRDAVGAVQLLYVGIATAVGTHGIKYLVNDRWVRSTRLGRRPSNFNSKNNMPSGHSSMSSSAVYFIGRRYNAWLAIALSTITVLTMYARVALNAHTISAVLAGALLGILMAALLTSPRQGDGAVLVPAIK